MFAKTVSETKWAQKHGDLWFKELLSGDLNFIEAKRMSKRKQDKIHKQLKENLLKKLSKIILSEKNY